MSSDEPAEAPEGAFEAWYRRAWPALARAMSALTGDRALGEDLASEAAAHAYLHWDRVRDPSAWSYRVALNLARRRWRRIGRESSAAMRSREANQPDPEVNVDVWNAISALPTRQRTAVVLRYVADLQQDQIADVMRIAPGTVAATLHAARGRLRELLEDREAQ